MKTVITLFMSMLAAVNTYGQVAALADCQPLTESQTIKVNGYVVSGHVVDQDGVPMADVQITALDAVTQKQMSVVTTGTDGGYSLVCNMESMLSPVNVIASAKDYLAVNCLLTFTSAAQKQLDFTLQNRVVYPAGKQCTIVLPVAPDAAAGRYYRLYDQAGGKLVFLREKNPQAGIPYIFYPERDYQVDVAGLDLSQSPTDYRMPGTIFCGTYETRSYGSRPNNTAFWNPNESPDGLFMVGGLQAYLSLEWPYASKENMVFLEKEEEAMAYTPMAKEGRTWNYRGTDGDFREFILGDSVAFGETWKKVYIEKPLGSAPRLEKLIRERGQRVYTFKKRMMQMADFSLRADDKFPSFYEEMPYHLEQTGQDSIASQGNRYRRINFSQCDSEGQPSSLSPVSWIEGVSFGCGIYKSCIEANYVEMADAVVPDDMLDESCLLLSCYDGDVCIYRSDDVQVVNGVSTIRQSAQTVVQPLFDLQGRRLKEKPAKGIYIKNGQKMIIR